MEENLLALEAVLGPLHQRIVRAHSGEEALKALLRQEFAVVLLDIVMPGMDGFETAGTIKRLDQTKDVPIILVTGVNPGPDYAYRGYAVGAADFLTKPIDPWMLRTKVSVFLELYRKNQQLAAAVADSAHGERLAEVAEELNRIELLLRDGAASDPSRLADRVAELGRTVDWLRHPGGG
ncbi:response regulator [Streptomyces boluensis]